MFFERFREAWARLPAGLIRVGGPASEPAIDAWQAEWGHALPGQLRSFWRSFDGADLFHGSVAIAGVGADAMPRIASLNGPGTARADELVFAEAGPGDRFALDTTGRVWRLRAGSEERILSGSSFDRWLNAVIAREQIVYDRDGEFKAEAFEPDGEEVTPQTARLQAERGLRQDPGSAEGHHELGTALRRLGKVREAIAAFTVATELDPVNPWPWFDLGRAHLANDEPLPALAAFRSAAEHEVGLAAARLYTWAARAANEAGPAGGEALASARQEARARHGEIEEDLRRALDAIAGDDPEALDEARALLLALTGSLPPARRRLPIASTDAGEITPATPPRAAQKPRGKRTRQSPRRRS
ncbi:MAG TPA: tetratricopeptide repeat protein [Polyangia bacterium]|nr:tetratricopeptide repeat protein [Polyangia bacterium]